jgi:hypothetical protein
MKFVKLQKPGASEIWVNIEDVCTIERISSHPKDCAAISFRGDSKSVLIVIDAYEDVVNLVTGRPIFKTTSAR